MTYKGVCVYYTSYMYTLDDFFSIIFYIGIHYRMTDASANFIKFRYTFSPAEADPNVAFEKIAKIVGYLKTPAEMTEMISRPMTIGVEEKDKCGNKTDKHLHVHFQSVSTVGTIRQRIMRFFKSIDEKRKGNKLYSLTQEEDVKDNDRFFRYPYKQGLLDDWPLENYLAKKYNIFPEAFDYDLQMRIAYEEWSRDVEFNCETKRRKEAKEALKDELFIYLQGLPENERNTPNLLLISILKYYVEGERVCNKQTILGLLNTACLKFGLITYEAMARDWLQ